jgi:membrane protease YdiL (CAAX protease family)
MDEQEPQAPSFLTFTVVLELGLGAIALLLGWVFGPDPRMFVPHWSQYTTILLQVAIGIVAALPLLLAINLLERLPFRAVRKLQEETEEKLIKLMADFSKAELATVSLCAGVGEEMLFRGWLMMHLAGTVELDSLRADALAGTMSPMILLAIIGSSIAFGLAHPITPLYILVTGLIGVFMAILMVGTGSLIAPIAAHAFYDLVQLLIAVRQYRSQHPIA